MILPAGPDLYPVVEGTWAPVRAFRVGPWMIREGGGGGQRVSAATAEPSFDPSDLAMAEKAMRDLGQKTLFMIREGDAQLDALLERQGYRIHDPVALYAIDIGELTSEKVPPVSAFSIWPPLAIQKDIWREAGIGPERCAVMDRVQGPKTSILARHNDQPAGAGFIACLKQTAMIHSVEVVPSHRRQGVGSNILRQAAHWAQDQGATVFSLAVTRSNEKANPLYTSLGMQVVGYYHYRVK
ncbi:N-acetyltransferase [Pseudoruegeria sp. HB172150]|uniref:GNAT family N-acetyltransferase n=1 Tax=Pseudoruegeria sp. HB172150 TaxID=2721164 RepID=UPI001555CE4B|nr:GNAT family N-acetyltransferase [Pseudoruegeria sp. HB172150]